MKCKKCGKVMVDEESKYCESCLKYMEGMANTGTYFDVNQDTEKDSKTDSEKLEVKVDVDLLLTKSIYEVLDSEYFNPDDLGLDLIETEDIKVGKSDKSDGASLEAVEADVVSLNKVEADIESVGLLEFFEQPLCEDNVVEESLDAVKSDAKADVGLPFIMSTADESSQKYETRGEMVSNGEIESIHEFEASQEIEQRYEGERRSRVERRRENNTIREDGASQGSENNQNSQQNEYVQESETEYEDVLNEEINTNQEIKSAGDTTKWQNNSNTVSQPVDEISLVELHEENLAALYGERSYDNTDYYDGEYVDDYQDEDHNKINVHSDNRDPSTTNEYDFSTYNSNPQGETIWDFNPKQKKDLDNKSDYDTFFSKVSGNDSILADEIHIKHDEKKRKRIIVVGAIAAIVLFVIIFYASGIYEKFMSPREVYLSAEAKNSENIYTGVTASIKDTYQKNFLDLQKNSYSRSAELTFKIESPIKTNTIKRYADLLNRITIKENTLVDSKAKSRVSNYIVSQKNLDFLELKLMRNDKTYTFGADKIYKRYYKADLSKPKEFFAGFGFEADSLPEKYVGTDEVLNAIDINEETIKNILTRYSEVYASSLKDVNVTKMDTAQKTIGNQVYTCKRLKVSLSSFEIYDMYNKIFESMKNDKELYSIFEKNALALLNLYLNTEIKSVDKVKNLISFEKYKKFIETYLGKSILTRIDETGKIREFDVNMVVNISDIGEIVSREIDIIDRQDNPDSTKPNFNVKVNMEQISAKNKFFFNIDYINWNGIYKVSYNVVTTKEDSTNEDKLYSWNGDYKETRVDPKDKTSLFKLLWPISGSLKVVKTTDESTKKTTSNHELKLSAAAKKAYATNIGVNLKKEITIPSEVKIPTLNEADVLNLNKVGLLDMAREILNAKKPFTTYLNRNEDVRRVFIDILKLFKYDPLGKINKFTKEKVIPILPTSQMGDTSGQISNSVTPAPAIGNLPTSNNGDVGTSPISTPQGINRREAAIQASPKVTASPPKVGR